MLVRRKTACHGFNSGGLNVSAAMPARHSACVAWVIGWVVMLVKQAGVTLMFIAARAMVELAIGWKRLLAAEHLLGGAADDQQLNQPCPVSQACRTPLGRPLPVLSAVSISSLFEHAVRERLGCSAVQCQCRAQQSHLRQRRQISVTSADGVASRRMCSYAL
jgi:hypothetical protein